MKKTIMVLILAFTVLFTNASVFADQAEAGKATGTSFTDVKGHWAEAAINKLTDKDLYADKEGRFQPDKAITRSEFVLMLHKELGIQIEYLKATDIGEFFDDVKNEDAYAGALYDLVITNIIDGKGHFNPEGKLTREDMVHYIMNAYRYKMGDKYKMVKILSRPFADNNQINPSYSGDVARAENMGLIKRPVNNRFYPKTDATRAQAAVMVGRLLAQLDKEDPQVRIFPSAEMKDGSLVMRLRIVNDTNTKVVINHSSSQQFDFKLLDVNNNELYTWSADKMFAMHLTETAIEPGKAVEFTGEVEKSVLDGIKAKVAYVKAYIVGKTDGFEINPEGYSADVKL